MAKRAAGLADALGLGVLVLLVLVGLVWLVKGSASDAPDAPDADPVDPFEAWWESLKWWEDGAGES